MIPRRVAPKRRGHVHCLVWAFGMDDGVLVKCAHCVFVKQRLNIEGTYDAELIRRQVAETQAGHSRLCQRKW